MDREVGDRNFPLWLIGDSNPKNWQFDLATPLDPRHPVRHNIWTSVLDVIQGELFRANKSRVDTSSLYIRNAVDNPDKKPNQSSREWDLFAENEVADLQGLIKLYQPIIVCCFGAFAFEFTRRALGEQEKQKYGHWGARRLGVEFRQRISEFSPKITNLLPLLHRSISGGKFRESHEYFCGQPGANYFENVGTRIADTLIQYKSQLPIWIE